jgi:hypothetical protein
MVVGELWNGCTVDATGMKTEHLKEWLAMSSGKIGRTAEWRG